MFDIRPIALSGEHIAETARFLRLVWPKAQHITAAYLDWEYNQNPCGAALGFNAYRNGEMMAHCAVQPLEARLHGEIRRGVLSLNAATHPDARRQGLYFDLVKRTYAKVAEAGYEFGVAVTNHRSTAGFVKHVGFECLGPLDVRIGIGLPGRRKNAPTPEFEKHWAPEMLAWRLANPSVSYRIAPGKSGDRVLIYGPSGFAGFQTIMGVLPKSSLPDAVEAQSRGTGIFRLWAGFDPAADWRRSPFLPLPMALRPSPLNFIFKEMGHGKPAPGLIRFTPIDFDNF
ncbi:MAG: GNAT family N-acetyltransferase [Deltaproteobacteria bacterium]|jgi:GNAT superfamily N-acetyltransferase|nr:GNAT family N-acetyltransferase [Deltaproteobacteria bacterium]MBW2540902.1 GNAT family N-acetyltransferase [Deltaproteobacteria bacterium]